MLTAASMNTTAKVNAKMLPIKSKLNQTVSISAQSNQIAASERRVSLRVFIPNFHLFFAFLTRMVGLGGCVTDS